MLTPPRPPPHATQTASANRTSWFPGSKLPDHLDGSLPGDYGFDPLGLVSTGDDSLHQPTRRRNSCSNAHEGEPTQLLEGAGGGGGSSRSARSTV
jgi:hypothetical protein